MAGRTRCPDGMRHTGRFMHDEKNDMMEENLMMIEENLIRLILATLTHPINVKRISAQVAKYYPCILSTRNPRLIWLLAMWVVSVDGRYHDVVEEKIRRIEAGEIRIPIADAPYVCLAKAACELHKRNLAIAKKLLTSITTATDPLMNGVNDPDLQIAAWHLLAVVLKLQYQYKASIDCTQKAKALTGDDEVLKATLSLNELWCLFQMNEGAARELLARIKPIIDRTGDPYSIGFLHFVLARIEQRTDSLDKAMKEINEAIRQLKDCRSSLRLRCLGQKAIISQLMARRENNPRKRTEAVAMLDEVIAACGTDEWNRTVHCNALITKGYLALDTHDYENGHRYADQAHLLSNGDAVLRARALVLWARLIVDHLSDGSSNPEIARTAKTKIEEAEKIVSGIDHRRLQIRVAIWRGKISLLRDISDATDAARCLEKATRLLRPEDKDSLRAQCDALRVRLTSVTLPRLPLTQMRTLTSADLMEVGCGEKLLQQHKSDLVCSMYIDLNVRSLSELARRTGWGRVGIRKMLRERGLRPLESNLYSRASHVKG